MKYIIGADGGGTKTILSAADTSGSVLTDASAGGINYNFIGVERAADNFNAGVKKLGIKPEDIAAIAIGDPSIDDINILPATSAFISELRNKIPLPNDCKLFIKSDAFMTLYGVTSGETGVLIISGTGAMGIALDSGGNVHVAGGWGRLTEDEGSGYYIAINGMKAALRYHDGIGQHTLLYKAMLDFFNEPNP
ncbi:MAG: BadF/BadG/BcrA/BcrD ATPase family protein, partial [Eubacteriales bacterium]|nr:BadF/BadG/BcrA/BcrD ATPase family protein [Eubacteriales bacterium]